MKFNLFDKVMFFLTATPLFAFIVMIFYGELYRHWFPRPPNGIIINEKTAEEILAVSQWENNNNFDETENQIYGDDDFYVCGQNYTQTLCKCYEFYLNCNHLYDSPNDKLNDTNLKVSKHLYLKAALFSWNAITVLEKGKILPEREKTIEKLYFLDNEINFIENGTFDLFSKLEILSLSKNSLTTITDDILTFQLGSTLEELDLSENKLKILDLSETFKYMKRLTKLDLTKNENMTLLNIFPESLSSLEFLLLNECGILELDDDIFKNLRNLRTLFLKGNPIISIPKSFNALSNLWVLDISNTNIDSLNFLKDYPFNLNFNRLFAKETKIQEIEDCAFCRIPNIEYIELNGNANLSFIHENAFGSLSFGKSANLKEFLVKNCNLSKLSENLFDWKKAYYFSIHNNPFTCDCSMAWLINFINSDEYKRKYFDHYYFKLKCNNPPNLKDLKFYEVVDKICV